MVVKAYFFWAIYRFRGADRMFLFGGAGIGGHFWGFLEGCESIDGYIERFYNSLIHFYNFLATGESSVFLMR